MDYEAKLRAALEQEVSYNETALAALKRASSATRPTLSISHVEMIASINRRQQECLLLLIKLTEG